MTVGDLLTVKIRGSPATETLGLELLRVGSQPDFWYCNAENAYFQSAKGVGS